MPEEMPQGTPPRRPAGDRERRSGRSGKKPTLAGMQVILVQSVSCIVVVLLVLIIKLVGGDAFAQLRQQFNESIMSNSIVATLAALFETPNAPADSSTPGSEPPAASSEPESSPGGSESGSGSESGGDATATGSAAPAQTGGSATGSSAAQAGATTAPSGSATTDPSGTTATSGATTAATTAQTVRYAPEGSSFTTIKANRLAVAPLSTGTVTSAYGYRKNPTKEGTGFHKGMDIGAPAGTAIHAMYFGVVSAAGQDPTYGNYVKLYHGNGIEILYAHCSEVLVQKDTVVKAGEVVAKVGSTGDSTGNHLHIELRVNGVTYNPVGLLPVERYA